MNRLLVCAALAFSCISASGFAGETTTKVHGDVLRAPYYSQAYRDDVVRVLYPYGYENTEASPTSFSSGSKGFDYTSVRCYENPCQRFQNYRR